MKTLKERFCTSRVAMGTVFVCSMIVGVLFYDIVSTPDAGGIWDGYVPTWLGGTGPSEVQ